MRAVEHHVVTC